MSKTMSKRPLTLKSLGIINMSIVVRRGKLHVEFCDYYRGSLARGTDHSRSVPKALRLELFAALAAKK